MSKGQERLQKILDKKKNDVVKKPEIVDKEIISNEETEQTDSLKETVQVGKEPTPEQIRVFNLGVAGEKYTGELMSVYESGVEHAEREKNNKVQEDEPLCCPICPVEEFNKVCTGCGFDEDKDEIPVDKKPVVKKVKDIPFDKLMIQFMKILKKEPVLKTMKLKVKKLNDTKWVLYQGSVNNRWATMYKGGYVAFYRTSIKRYLRRLEEGTQLRKYFDKYI